LLRATKVSPAGRWKSETAIDRVTLDYDARHRRRFQYTAEAGTAFLLDLPRATVLNDGDGLALEDGRVIAVAAAPEVLVEVTAPDAATLMRLAWHIGNRHLPAELGPERIRLRDDHVINAMLRGLGGMVTPITAPFTPESGAYAGGEPAGGGHGHDHGHHHHDDNRHHDHHHDH
jgi:urease accessory protein